MTDGTIAGPEKTGLFAGVFSPRVDDILDFPDST
jgi:hypothetical protein